MIPSMSPRLLSAGPIMFLAFSCACLARAGSLEAAGRLEEARAIARSASIPAQGVLMLSALVLLMAATPLPRSAAVIGLASGGGVVALLAALSRKPRPSVYFATGLLSAAVVAMFLVR